MFDSSKIIKVLKASLRDSKLKNDDYFFCVSPVIEYGVAYGNWIILQTEKDFISIGADGVIRYDEAPFNAQDYDISDADFADEDGLIESVETTLFVGERLIRVNKRDGGFILNFDDFDMYLSLFTPENFWYERNAKDIPIKGFERHITGKCECGGVPELMIDSFSNFYIRCNKCHKSTLADFELRMSIDDWNNGIADTVIDTPEEKFAENICKPIKYIAIDELGVCYDENQWDCNNIIISFGDSLFEVGGQRIGENQYGFKFDTLLDYNPKMWPHLILAGENEPITFIRTEQEPEQNTVMRLSIGSRPILITATDSGIMIGISHFGLNDEWLEFDNNVLVNGKQG